MKHRPYYNYYDITIVTVFERCVKPIVTFCAQIIVLKWNIAFERKQIEFLKYKDLSYFRYHFSNKKTPKPLISQGFRRPCQVVEVTGFEPTTSASRTLSGIIPLSVRKGLLRYFRTLILKHFMRYS